MAPRLPYAAQQLIKQATETKAKTTYESEGDPDGLNVHRTIKFNKATSKWLAPLLNEISDPRITEANLTSAGYLHVTFASGPVADNRDPFPLGDAETVTGATPDESDEG